MELSDRNKLFVGLKLDTGLRRQLEAVSGPDRKYVSGEDPAFLRIVSFGDDLYVGKVIDDQIGDKAWIVGEGFSAADIYLFMLTTWLDPSRGQPSVDEFSSVKRIAKAVTQRPSVQFVYQDWIAAQKVTGK